MSRENIWSYSDLAGGACDIFHTGITCCLSFSISALFKELYLYQWSDWHSLSLGLTFPLLQNGQISLACSATLATLTKEDYHRSHIIFRSLPEWGLFSSHSLVFFLFLLFLLRSEKVFPQMTQRIASSTWIVQ